VTEQEYEYGIEWRIVSARDDTPHRVGMTEIEASDWIAEWLEDGGLATTFIIIRRPIGVWEPVDA